jgi:hypothetical protein
MVDNGTSDTSHSKAGRKHFGDNTTSMSSSEIGTAPTVFKNLGRKYIEVPDHVKAELEEAAGPPPPPLPPPVEPEPSSHDRAWSSFADSLSQVNNRRGL